MKAALANVAAMKISHAGRGPPAGPSAIANAHGRPQAQPSKAPIRSCTPTAAHVGTPMHTKRRRMLSEPSRRKRRERRF
jgi:hypothetical protein